MGVDVSRPTHWDDHTRILERYANPSPLEKHRPKTLAEFGPGLHVEMAKNYLRGRPKKFLLLHGPPGCGKTTLVRCLVAEFDLELLDLNASDDRSGAAVRAAIDASLSGIAVFCDEADTMGGREQKQLAKAKIGGPFFLAANEVGEIDYALKNECLEVFVPPPSRDRLRAVARLVGASPKAVVQASSYRDLILESAGAPASAAEVTAQIIGGDREAGSITDVMRCEAWILDNTEGPEEALEFDRWRSRYRSVGNLMSKHLRRAAACGVQAPKFPWSVALKGRLKREREQRERAPEPKQTKAERLERERDPVPAPRLPDMGADDWV